MNIFFFLIIRSYIWQKQIDMFNCEINFYKIIKWYNYFYIFKKQQIFFFLYFYHQSWCHLIRDIRFNETFYYDINNYLVIIYIHICIWINLIFKSTNQKSCLTNIVFVQKRVLLSREPNTIKHYITFKE